MTLQNIISEYDLGLRCFLTRCNGIGGRLKARASDFIVREIPIEIKSCQKSQGLYTIIKIELRDWETHTFAMTLAKQLGISTKDITFAGTKDRRAITSQYFCIRGSIDTERIKSINAINGAVVEGYLYSRRPIHKGDCVGNEFEIIIRDISISDDMAKILNACINEINEFSGFLNYYGVQRFGTVRPITHHVGKCIIKRDYRGAIMWYVAKTMPWENDNIKEMRGLAAKEKWSEALEILPKYMNFERILLKSLSSGSNYLRAIRCMPRDLITLFVHAYQSYLFNLILSIRIERGLDPFLPLEGDFVLAKDIYGGPNRHRFTKVDRSNRDFLESKCKKNMAFVATPVIGYEIPQFSGEMEDIIAHVMESEDVSMADFILEDLPFVRPKGVLRANKALYNHLKYKIISKDTVKFNFMLFKGSYATCLLREFMKSNDITSYS